MSIYQPIQYDYCSKLGYTRGISVGNNFGEEEETITPWWFVNASRRGIPPASTIQALLLYRIIRQINREEIEKDYVTKEEDLTDIHSKSNRGNNGSSHRKI